MSVSSYPFRAIGLCAAFVVYKYSLQVFPGAISHSLMSEFGMNGLTAGHLSGAFLYTLVMTQLFVGYWLDRYSVVRLISSAIGLASVGAIIFSMSQSFHIMLVARALMGMGGAFAAAGYFKMTSLVVPKQYFGLVNGLLATAMTLGIILGKMPFSILISYFPWRNILFGVGIVGGVLALFFLFLLDDTHLKKHQESSNPQHSGPPISYQDIIAILKNPQNWLLTLYNGLVYSPVGVFTGLWGVSFLKEAYHISFGTANLLSACIFIGFGVGSPCIGLLADKKGSGKKLMLYNGLLGLSAVLLLVYVPYLPLWLLGVLLFLIGFSAGTVMLGFVLGKAMNTSRTEATLVTLLNTGGVMITAITEPLVGYLLDLYWNGEWITEGVRYFSLHNYQYGFLVLPLYLIAALVLLFYIREPKG